MITIAEVKKIATLARLSFKDEEYSYMAEQLTDIMSMVDKLSEVDCDGILPLTSVLDQVQRLRKDEVTEQNISDQLFANAPGKSGTLARDIKCFVVPKVIE